NNLLNNILAKIQANVAGVDAAIMLDANGFVAELNDTNLFMVKDGVVLTPPPDACLAGITRGLVIELCRQAEIPVVERNLSLTEFYNADEVFATGTMGELTPVREIDGRPVKQIEDRFTEKQIEDRFTEKQIKDRFTEKQMEDRFAAGMPVTKRIRELFHAFIPGNCTRLLP